MVPKPVESITSAACRTLKETDFEIGLATASQDTRDAACDNLVEKVPNNFTNEAGLATIDATSTASDDNQPAMTNDDGRGIFFTK